MSVDVLMRELAALGPADQRKMIAYLLTLRDEHDLERKRRLAAKINEKDLSKFATLEDLDRRFGLAEDPPSA